MSKEIYISYIVELIRNECFTTANSAFNFHLTDPKRPKPTKGITQFKQYWKIAQERYKEAQNLLTKKSDDVLLDEKIQAHKKAINERNERLEVLRQKFNKLSKIKLGKSVLRYDDGTQEIIKVSLQDELKAVEALAKLDDRISKAEGTDAPTKTATTSVNGEDLEDPITTLIKKGGKIIINGGK